MQAQTSLDALRMQYQTLKDASDKTSIEKSEILSKVMQYC